MLVLSRKVGQSLVIGNDVVVVLQSVKGSQAKISIEAPPSVNVRRGELPPREQAATAAEPETRPDAPVRA